jgi:hypothetical protein
MLFPVFCVETQRTSIVYMSMNTGVIFTKDAERFHGGMDYVSNPQEDVEPCSKQTNFDFNPGGAPTL